jgi:hypothetical protein
MLPHRRERPGGEPSVPETEPVHRRPAEVRDQTDRPSRGFLDEFMQAYGGDEKHRTGSDRAPLRPDSLLAVPAQVEKQLPVGVAVGRKAVERLEVAVYAQGPHRPITTLQAEAAEQDRLDWRRRALRHKHNQ